MPDNKFLRNTLMGFGLVALIAGQALMLNGRNLAAGIVLMAVCVAMFAVALTGVYAVIAAFIQKTAETLVNSFKKNKEAADNAGVKKKTLPQTAKPDEAGAPRPVFLIDGLKAVFTGGSHIFRFSIPRWVIFAVAAVLFGITQLLFFKDSLKPALFMLTADVLLLAAAVSLKNGLKVEFGIESGLKILSVLSGMALVAIGWIFLINPNITSQEIGVVFTIPGAVLLYLGLPRDVARVEDATRADILFVKPDFLNNYIVKALMLVAAFALFKAGVRVMQDLDYNMYSMIFYFAAGALVFLALPLFNFAETSYNSRILDFIKLGAVIAAVVVAYRGQTFFVKHNVNTAVNHYFIAAVLFIFAFPVHLARENEEKEHFPLGLEIVFLAVIIAAGAFLRFYEIDVRPFGIENDEAGGLTARMSRNGVTTLALPVGNFGIYAHIVRIFIAIFGGMDRVGIKFMPAIVGIIAIPVIYFLIRDLFNAKTAIFAAVVFTFMRWNVYYSRYTSPVIMSLCTEAMAVYFFFKAIETGKKMMWFMAGLCIGITWHGPMTFFLLIIPFVIYLFIAVITKKGFLKANTVGILAFLFGFWLFGSMIVHNYFISQRIYFGRVAEVSVFSKDPNAPSKNPAKGIVEQTQQVLLMFNNAGDSRQRNSGGQPYEPAVDFLTSMLFMIGFMYAIYYSKYYQFFIMVMIFFSQAAGSIFSIEAPSAMRAVGTMIPVIFFVSFTFDRILMAFRKTIGKRLELVYMPVLLLIFLVPISVDNYKQYFTRWIGGMDELATAAGMYSKKLGNNTRIVLYTSLYYPGHPPYKFFRWDYKVNSADRFTTGLTRLIEVNDEDFAIFFHYDTWGNMESIRQTLFPEAKITIVDHKMFNPKLKDKEGFGTLIKAMEIKNEEIRKIRGLTGVYSFGGPPRVNETPGFVKNDDAKMPYNADWKGQILIPYYGKFRFYNKAPAGFKLYIDGNLINAGRELLLGEGFHKIGINAFRKTANDNMDLYADAKKLDGGNIIGSENIHLDSRYLYNVPSFGLHGYFFRGFEWTANPIRYEVINTNMCFGGGGILTESAVWRGNIKIPVTDVYSITTVSNGYMRIIIDGKYYWDQAVVGKDALDRVDKYFSGRKLEKVNEFGLKAGKHSIEIYCMNSSLLELKWRSKLVSNETVDVPVDALEPDYKISAE